MVGGRALSLAGSRPRMSTNVADLRVHWPGKRKRPYMSTHVRAQYSEIDSRLFMKDNGRTWYRLQIGDRWNYDAAHEYSCAASCREIGATRAIDIQRPNPV